MKRRIFYKGLKFWVILSSILVSIFLVMLGVYYYLSFYAKIDSPTGLQVISHQNNEIYLHVDANERAVSYEFKIEIQNQNTQYLISKKNLINVTPYFNKVGEFIISSKIIGPTNISNSDYCDSITFTKVKKLATPEIELKQDLNKLNFTLEDNLPEGLEIDYLLYFGASETDFLIDDSNYEILSSNNGMICGYFNLNFLPTGEYSLAIKIKIKNNDLYLESNLSRQVLYIKN